MTNRIVSYRCQLASNDGADFVAYQRRSGAGAWQTVSVWMIPKAVR